MINSELQYWQPKDFCDSPVVQTSSSDGGSGGLISGWGAKFPHASWWKNQNIKKKKKKKKNRYPNEMVVCASKFCGSLLFHGSVQFCHSVLSDSLQPHELQHARPPCPSPTPRVYPNSCPSSWWCHPAISSSVVPFSSCPQSFPASGSFPISQLFTWGGQNIGVSASASVLSMNTQDWSPLGWTGWISLQSKGLSRVFSNTTDQKHQFFGSIWNNLIFITLFHSKSKFDKEVDI